MEWKKNSKTHLAVENVRRKTIHPHGATRQKPIAQFVAMAIKLLKKFLEEFVERCGVVIVIRTNVGEFSNYILKDCYPKGLDRESFIESVAINRRLDREGEDCAEEPRHLKTNFIY